MMDVFILSNVGDLYKESAQTKSIEIMLHFADVDYKTIMIILFGCLEL